MLFTSQSCLYVTIMLFKMSTLLLYSNPVLSEFYLALYSSTLSLILTLPLKFQPYLLIPTLSFTFKVAEPCVWYLNPTQHFNPALNTRTLLYIYSSPALSVRPKSQHYSTLYISILLLHLSTALYISVPLITSQLRSLQLSPTYCISTLLFTSQSHSLHLNAALYISVSLITSQLCSLHLSPTYYISTLPFTSQSHLLHLNSALYIAIVKHCIKRGVNFALNISFLIFISAAFY